MRVAGRTFGIAIASLVATFFIIPTQVFAVTDYDSSRFITRPSLNSEPNAQSGAFEQSYQFTIPPGRNGMQPSLGLSYSSGNTGNVNEFGYGWSLSIPSITRLPKHGTDDLYTRHDFSSTLSGELTDMTLSDATHGTFGATADDGSELKYTYSTSETWTAVDKNGTTYTFGASSSARVADPSNSAHVYEWMLTSVTDLLGNTVTYTYTTDGAQVYPSTINYTGFGSTSGIFNVSFALESRSDSLASHSAGFLVTTSYRVKTVAVAVNTQTVRSYALAYGAGDDGLRSLLSSITETATTDDGASSLTKPATTFTYADGNNAWASSSVTFPETIAGDSAGSLGVYLFDMNGDGIPDIVKSRDTNRAIYTGNANGTWTASSVTVPLAFSSPIGKDMGVRVMDMNGDGALDLVYARYSSTGTLDQSIYINNNDGTGWTLSTTASVPIGFTTDGGLYLGVEAFDVDGDGLADIVKSRDGQTQEVYINNGDGTGWTLTSGYTVPVYFASTLPSDLAVRQMDVNGDGLTDLVYARYISGTLNQAVYINNGDGTGWTQDTTWSVPLGFITSTSDYGVRPMDVNGDGLVDLVYHRDTGVDAQSVYINTGKSWVLDSSITTPFAFTTGSVDFGVRIDDFDADGISDFLKSRNVSGTTTNELYLATGVVADLMTSTTTAQGGSTAVTYGSSANGSNTALPFVMQVTSSVTTNDGLGNTATKTYAFTGGDYYGSYFEKKFAGFGTMTATDAAGSTKQFFHQGNTTNSTQGESTDSEAKIGHQYREERADTTGHIYRTIIDSWSSTNLGTNRDFIYRSQNLELLYGSGSTHTDRATAFTYDTAGNLTQQLEYGSVTGTDGGGVTDTGTDKRTTTWTYATSSTLGETAHRSSEKLTNSSSSQIQYTKWYYDSLAYGSVSNGLVSKQTNYTTTSVSYNTTYTYNTYGNLLTAVDPASHTTTYTPDSVYLYPATVTDALSHATTYTYDYSSGQVKTTVDPNSKTSSTTYDAFDRPTVVAAPSGSSTVTVSEYVYTDSAVPTSVHTTDWFDASTARETYTYFDGFGRNIQNRVEAEGSNTYNVSDTVYDSLGRISSVSLPYSQSGSTRTAATTTTALLTTTTYDALDRAVSSVNATGTATKSYSGLAETDTDVNGNITINTLDSFSRVASVGEKVGTSTYTTSYTYDAADHLTQTSDPLSYIRSLTYDNRGARLTSKDLRSSSDTTSYGTWTFTYNSTGTMATSVSPDAVTTTYAYDSLNRETSEDASSTTGTDLTYTYDSCTNGVGHICTATVLNGSTTSYTYDDRGRIASQVRTIGSNSYTTSYTYDRQGNIVTVTYPDSSVATNTLDTDGTLNSVVFVDGHGSASTTVISAVVYGTHGKPTSVTYGNGAVTTYTYDATKLYRLTTLNTVKGTTTLENFVYTYDNLGNITNLADTSSLYTNVTGAFTYDARSFLTAATSTSTNSALAYTKTWTYNTNGTLKTSTDCGTYTYGGNTAGNYANMQAPTSVCSKTLAYDKTGHLTGDGTWTHTWNGLGLLSQSAKTGVTVTYQYDESGNRVQQVSSVSGTTNSPNDYYTVDGTTYERNIIAGSLGNIATSTYNGTTSSMIYHHHDHLGGTHVETDSTGTAVEYTLYTPFGDTLLDTKTGTYENDHKYTNKELDTDTGLYYYGARYYNSHLGVFIAQDPVFVGLGSQDVKSVQKLIRDPQRTNSYSYSRNNPINLYDPDGRSFWGFLGNALDSVARASDAAFDFVSFGAVSEARTMATEGVTAGGVAHVVAGVVGGAVVTSLAAVDVGMAAGGLAIDLGAATARQSTTQATVTTDSAIHGNSLSSPATNYGYSLRDRATGTVLKYGETIHPERRYTQSWLTGNNAELQIEQVGTKQDIHAWQHDQIVQYKEANGSRPPLNKSDW